MKKDRLLKSTIAKIDRVKQVLYLQLCNAKKIDSVSDTKNIIEVRKRDRTRCRAIRKLLIDIYADIEKIEEDDNNAIIDLELSIDESYL